MILREEMPVNGGWKNFVSSFFAPERDVLEMEAYILSLEEEVKRLREERTMLPEAPREERAVTETGIFEADDLRWENRELRRDLERVRSELSQKNEALFKIAQLLNQTAFGSS